MHSWPRKIDIAKAKTVNVGHILLHFCTDYHLCLNDRVHFVLDLIDHDLFFYFRPQDQNYGLIYGQNCQKYVSQVLELCFRPPFCFLSIN